MIHDKIKTPLTYKQINNASKKKRRKNLPGNDASPQERSLVSRTNAKSMSTRKDKLSGSFNHTSVVRHVKLSPIHHVPPSHAHT